MSSNPRAIGEFEPRTVQWFEPKNNLGVRTKAQSPLVGALAVGFFLSGFWGTRGCTDVSALNYAPAATADDGTCVGSMYELSGVFEFQTTAAAAPKQLEAIGIEFEADMQMQMVIVNKVSPGSVAASSGVRAGDELLAMKDASSVVLVSSRGYSGAINAVQAVMGAWPGTPLRWVLRHAAALGGIEDIHLVSPPQAASCSALRLPSALSPLMQEHHHTLSVLIRVIACCGRHMKLPPSK